MIFRLRATVTAWPFRLPDQPWVTLLIHTPRLLTLRTTKEKSPFIMNTLFVLVLLAIPPIAGYAAEPRLLVSAGKSGWTNPVISPDGQKIAFADASLKQIRVLISGEDTSREVVTNPGVGRRFVFEPGGQDRIIYRRKVQALPDHPERLLSVSIYLFDPASRTSNAKGNLFGPYLIEGRIWYRDSLTGPFMDLQGKVRKAGPNFDQTSGQLRVLDAAGKIVFASTPPQTFAAMEISPNGRWVAAVQTSPERELFLISVDNGAVIRVNSAVDPGWSGNSLTAICVRRIQSRPPELYLIHLPKGDGASLFAAPDFDPETPVLNADGTRAVFVSKGAVYDLDIAP